MTFNNMKVSTRLALGFGSLILLLLIISGTALLRVAEIVTDTGLVVNDRMPKVTMSDEVSQNILIIARSTRNIILSNNKQFEKQQLEIIASTRKHNGEILEKIEGMLSSEKGKQMFAEVTDARTKYNASLDVLLSLADSSSSQWNVEKATQYLFGEYTQLANSYVDKMKQFADFQKGLADEAGKDAEAAGSSTRIAVITLAIISFIVAAVLAVWITRSILRQLGGEPDYAAHAVGRIAAGDLTIDLEIKRGDTTSLLYSLKTMQDALRHLIHEIKDSTDTINTASKEIASGNSDLSQRTEEQASSLEETASSMEELTSTVRQNTENAKQANQLAISASDVAGKGGAVVSQVVTTMDSINESSRKIVDIISVIDGIAFQTNILALNAAVEAARAGEQGRGFAVVAGEVRNLAQRSAAAAKEIKTLIGDSVEKVEGGSKLVAQAGQTMEEIVTSIKRVTDIMSEITAASVEQSQGIEQVNTAITQMDEVTQQNAALVEEAAAAAESLEEQAQNLSASVATFKVDDAASQGTVRAVAATAAAAPAAPAAHRAAPAPARKAVAAPKAASSKSTAVAKPKAAKASEDGEWQEF